MEPLTKIRRVATMKTSEENPFADVRERDFYYDCVPWAAKHNITNGVSNDRFGLELYCTRG